MVLLIEEPLGASQYLRDVVAAARALGVRVHAFPRELGMVPDAPRIPRLEQREFEWGVLFADAPTPTQYARIFDEARALNVTLLNDLQQHRTATELDRGLPALGELTARTEVLTEADAVVGVVQRLGMPVFVRGALQSQKAQGWAACVAQDVAAAHALVTQRLSQEPVVLVRELLPLRRPGAQHQGFPVAREYRLFVLDADVVALGSAWPSGDPFGALTEREDRDLRELAHEVARRTRVPWLTVDVGQLESGAWKVIETGDPGCSALASVAPQVLLASLRSALKLRAGR